MIICNYVKLAFFFVFCPFFLLGQKTPSCNSVTISSATNTGNYIVGSYLESDGIRDGDYYYGSTVYYPENPSVLLPSVIVIPGYANPELSIQAWGPFLASHGIVCMTIGTNSLLDEVYDRKLALEDALISLKKENIRIGSPLFNKLDTNLFALAGWSMGGGGAQLVASEDASIKALLVFCPWIDPATVSPSLLNHNTPVLFFSGQIDAVAPPGAHANVQYNYTPNTTKKLKYEVFLGGHTIANTPLGGGGEVGRMGLSWLKKYLVNDSCYCPLLLDVPNSSSDYITNINCSDVSPSWDCVDEGCLDFGLGNGEYSSLSSCLLDSCSTTTSSIRFESKAFFYPNPTNDMIFLTVYKKNSFYYIKNLNGKTLKKEKVSSNKIDVSYLKKGVYILEYENKKTKLFKN